MPSINETIQKAETEYGLGKGESFKVKDGSNKLRVLSELVFNESEYQGKPTYKMVCWILDRKDGVVKPYFMPLTLARTLGNMQEDPEYAFSNFPMPYDIIITAKGAGTIDVEYQLLASRQNTPLTKEELTAFKERMPIEEFVAKLNEKQGAPAKTGETPAEIVKKASGGRFSPRSGPSDDDGPPAGVFDGDPSAQ